MTLAVLFGITQGLFLVSMAVWWYFHSLPIDVVGIAPDDLVFDAHPLQLLLYPVLREGEETMRTTMHAIARCSYPKNRYLVVAIPNHDDHATIEALRRLQAEFTWLEVLPIPATTDERWELVWRSWETNPKAYWWHEGRSAGVTDLPPKKTRQLIYALYAVCHEFGEETLLSYIDADSAPPPNYFLEGAAGMRDYDVVQLTNVAGNLLDTWAASFHASDHVHWDSSMYPHMSANGRHPFYVLGKGVFFRTSDLVELGGFNPWITIEDPEVGLRFWTNGRRLGIVFDPLIEEVPNTFSKGVTQRKRWVCGFFQSLGRPLRQMGMTPRQRFAARVNFVPCLSLLACPPGYAIGLWVLVLAAKGEHPIDFGLEVLSVFNVVMFAVILAHNWRRSWILTRKVTRKRLRYALRVNPLFSLAYWLWWSVPILIGLQMYVRGGGLVWARTEKVDALNKVVRGRRGLLSRKR